MNGEILFKGEDLRSVSEERIRSIRGDRIAMVFQEPTTSLNPVLTVGRQISESLEIHRQLDKSEAMKESKGKANPKILNKLLSDKLNKI